MAWTNILLVLTWLCAAVVTASTESGNESSQQGTRENSTTLLQRKSRDVFGTFSNIQRYDDNDSNDADTFSEKLKEDSSNQIYSDSLTPIMRMNIVDNSESMIPTIRFGRSSGTTIPNIRFGRSMYDSTIPMIRFGRESQYSTIPTIRFGRSSGSTIPNIRFGRSSYDSTIPTIRFGRSSEDSLIPTLRFGRSSGSTIPNIRFGRSMYDSTIPMIRFGRSSEDSLIPTIRFGRSDDDNELMLPTLRFGRASSSDNDSVIPQIRFGKALDQPQPADDGSFEDLDNNGSSRSEIDDEPGLGDMHSHGSVEENSGLKRDTFMVPYPRPGRMLELKYPPFKLDESLDQIAKNLPDSADDDDMDSQFVIPYPRPGKKSAKSPDPKKWQATPSSDKFDHSIAYVLPYPRPGKRSKRSSEAYIIPFPRPGRNTKRRVVQKSKLRDSPANAPTPDSYITAIPIFPGSLLDYHSKNLYNSRPGRSDDAISSQNHVPKPFSGHSSRAGGSQILGTQKVFPPKDFEASILPYPRPGRSSYSASHSGMSKKSESMVPYPRPGKSVRYGALKKSDFMLPTLRVG